jgi:hypothetical protein
MSGPSSQWGPCSWGPALTRRCQKRGAERPSIPSALALTFEKLTLDVLDPERHERAFPWSFDRGHCGGKFAVDSPLEGDGFEPPVPQQIRSRFRGNGSPLGKEDCAAGLTPDFGQHLEPRLNRRNPQIEDLSLDHRPPRLLVAPRRRASEERVCRIGSRQMQRPSICGDRVLKPYFDRTGMPRLSAEPYSR